LLGFQVQSTAEKNESGITVRIANKRQKHIAIEHYEIFLSLMDFYA